MNYYLWKQACADAQIGKVMFTITTPGNEALNTNTIVIFTSDHGDYGGSHTLKGKGGAAYDESINAPLYIQYPAHRSSNAAAIIIPQMVSSVDMMPYLLTLASGGNGWRALGQRYHNLGNREAIDDFIFTAQTGSPTVRRTITVTDLHGVQQTLPYVLHTYDETTANEVNAGITYASQSPNTPTHMIALRTAVALDSQGHPFGGKFVKYDLWSCGGASPTQPPPQVSGGYHSQYEFYDWSSNQSENGNQVVLSNYQPTGAANALAPQLRSALDGLLPTEMYLVPPIYSAAHTTAQQQYLTAVGQCS